MLRLLKLSAYLLFGYFLFEAFRGIAETRPEHIAPAAPKPRRSLKTVLVDNASTGAHYTEKVGRGVIS